MEALGGPRNTPEEDGHDIKDARAQRAQQLRDIFVSHPVPRRPRAVALLILLVLVSALLACSLLLPWHHRYIGDGGYAVINGPNGANWVLPLVAALMGIVARLAFRPVGNVVVFFVAAAAFVSFTLMAADYIDSYGNVAHVQAQLPVPQQARVQAHDGSGFYVALGGTAGLIWAGVLAWRERPA